MQHRVGEYEGVALRKESVDRNCVLPSNAGEFLMSLSARRAWIEITSDVSEREPLASLSARRAWIEISVTRYRPTPKPGRSPQGERG